MNKKNLVRFTLGAMLLTLAACSQDEATDSNTLPDGKYPLQIASVSLTAESGGQPLNTNTPQTRVAENTSGNSSVWTAGDPIGVQIGGTSNVGTYTIQADNSIEATEPVYWKSTSETTVSGWYPTAEAIDLSDQSAGLKYVLKGTATGTYDAAIQDFAFTNQLAKVRVVFTGTADITKYKVQIKGYTSCTNNQGTVNGSTEGWITMQKVGYDDGTTAYEANLVPGTLDKDAAAIKIISSSNKETEINLEASLTLVGGKMHNITLTVDKKGTTTIDLTTATNPCTVTAGACVIIDGKSTPQENKQIVIENGATVMLKNVILNTALSMKPSIIVNGTATIIVSGTNKITATGQSIGGIAIEARGDETTTLTINGTLDDTLELIGKGLYGGALLSSSGANFIINGGNIIANSTDAECAGIGSYSAKCGAITINGGCITATAGNGCAGIGCTYETSCGNITISGGFITATAGSEAYGNYGAGIGSATISTCGTITISGSNTKVIATSTNKDKAYDIGKANTNNSTCGTVTITDANVTATNGLIYGH